MVAKIGTNTSEATFKLIFVYKKDMSYRVNTFGPLCLWQCFMVVFTFTILIRSVFSEFHIACDTCDIIILFEALHIYIGT